MAYFRLPNSILAGTALIQNPLPAPLQPSGVIPVVVDAVLSSTSNLGVVQIGDNIKVTPSGVISVDLTNIKYNTTLVESDYTISEDDYYIGIIITGPITLSLPEYPSDGVEIIIKLEMPPPIGPRKVTVTTTDGSTIDGQDSIILTTPYQSITIISRDRQWFLI